MQHLPVALAAKRQRADICDRAQRRGWSDMAFDVPPPTHETVRSAGDFLGAANLFGEYPIEKCAGDQRARYTWYHRPTTKSRQPASVALKRSTFRGRGCTVGGDVVA